VKFVPNSPLALVDMIHNGPNNKSRNMSQATLSVAQLLQYNSCIRDEQEVVAVGMLRQVKLPFQCIWGLQCQQGPEKRKYTV